jgi:hypothetical protein
MIPTNLIRHNLSKKESSESKEATRDHYYLEAADFQRAKGKILICWMCVLQCNVINGSQQSKRES